MMAFCVLGPIKTELSEACPCSSWARYLLFQPAKNHFQDFVISHARSAPHVVAFRVNTHRFRITVLHQKIDVINRGLIIVFSVDGKHVNAG